MQPDQTLKSLGDETRLRLLYLLSVSEETLCVCEMMDALQLPQYQVSRHLGILRSSGLVRSERRGTWMYYTPETQSVGNAQIFQFVRSYLETLQLETPFGKDLERLQLRLALREGNCCVVGISEEGDSDA